MRETECLFERLKDPEELKETHPNLEQDPRRRFATVMLLADEIDLDGRVLEHGHKPLVDLVEVVDLVAARVRSQATEHEQHREDR